MKINEILLDFDCVCLYPKAMWDKNSIYPKIETGYAFEKHMNNELVSGRCVSRADGVVQDPMY